LSSPYALSVDHSTYFYESFNWKSANLSPIPNNLDPISLLLPSSKYFSLNTKSRSHVSIIT